MASVDKLVHTSTASLLSKFLRKRDASFNKIFCWVRREEGVFKSSPPNSPGTRLIEMTFPFAAYEHPNADRLAIFADWLVRAIALGAPELGIDEAECLVLKRRLADGQYIYVRTDKLKRIAGEPHCEAVYEHTPTELVVTARCKLPTGQTVARTLDRHPFIRDELVYGRAITRCSVSSDGRLTVETAQGNL